MKILLMADGVVGYDVTSWLIQNYPNDIGLVVTTSENDIYKSVSSRNIKCIKYESTEFILNQVRELRCKFDLGFSVWWPNIFNKSVLKVPRIGFINTHPSYLPHNRGKHPNFWALVEQAPFGVSLHFLDTGIDSGNIIAQKRIEYDWEDTGETLYQHALHEVVQLVINTYPSLRTLDISSTKQRLSEGSLHYEHELDASSLIDLNKKYYAKELFNLIRARTFFNRPASRFIDNGETFEVQIKISKVDS